MRKIRNGVTALSLAATIGLLTSGDARACASCGCSLNTDWQGLEYSYKPGLKIDMRYDYLNQDQLRSGTGTISAANASQQSGGLQEVEKYTENHYITLGIDYSTNQDWGINLQVPYIIRMHSTLGVGSDGTTPVASGGQYDSRISSLGDMKVIGRYQGFTSKHNLGALLGFKLATGSNSEYGTSTDPTAPGLVRIDPGLQPGTGTTDVIVGAYYNDAINKDWGYFSQVTYQTPLYSTDEYRPGNSLNVSLGIRYAGFDIIAPQLQFNFRDIQRDSGARADKVSTGGTLLYISPGVVAAVSDQVSLYAFVQVPIFQDVNGVQLAPQFIPSVGVRYSF
jgi:TonB dependent receptor